MSIPRLHRMNYVVMSENGDLDVGLLPGLKRMLDLDHNHVGQRLRVCVRDDQCDVVRAREVTKCEPMTAYPVNTTLAMLLPGFVGDDVVVVFV
jgi:hypothetical protein